MDREFLIENKNLVIEYISDLCGCNIDIIDFFLYPGDDKWRVMYINKDLDFFNYDRIKLNQNDIIKYIRKRKIRRLKNE